MLAALHTLDPTAVGLESFGRSAWSSLYWGDIGASIWTGTQAHRANPGFGTTDEPLNRYARASGRDLGAVEFYAAVATIKMAVIIAGARVRVSETDPQRAQQLEDKTRLLTRTALKAACRVPPAIYGRP
ncbi:MULTISPECIES: hypothetical protein [Pseudofrankia]|uniref:hypothetical protein n=1 Tax=Pseudofrankia TaxID=2994363 RepID=UPI000234CD74|nr:MULTISPECIES: hypothetical protein [Pseudofrankia]OHV32770.1 hypothetical protein BCD49_28415 [Pseudofrankia sp. EUN1h]